MLEMVQLEDGCYRVTVDYSREGFAIHKEWIFKETESEAKPVEGGELIRLKFEGNQ